MIVEAFIKKNVNVFILLLSFFVLWSCDIPETQEVLDGIDSTASEDTADKTVSAAEDTSSPLIRETKQGLVMGKEAEDRAYAWLGVPYAKPPVGELRWRTPQDPDPWEGVLDTVAFGSYCVQYGNFISETDPEAYGEVCGSEDCLYLNIWRPKTNEKKLPVFVFLYGGGNFLGRGDLTVYDGMNLAVKTNMITVTLNYRLATFGFFAHPAVRTGDESEDSGNFGTLDIIKMLKWLNENIKAFGGDKDNITISGQSAGALNVYSMMASPLAEGLFHRAIAFSGFPSASPMSGAEEGTGRIVNRLLKKDNYEIQGLSVINEEGMVVFDDLSDYLRSKTIEEVYDPNYSWISGVPLNGTRWINASILGIIADGYVIPKDPKILFKKGEYNHVPFIAGNTTEELKLFLPMFFFGENAEYAMIQGFDPDNPDVDINDWLNPLFRLLLDLYDPLTDVINSLFELAATDLSARGLSKHQDVYVYRFAWNDEPEPFDHYVGAGHAMDLPFVFGNFSTDPESCTRFGWSEENKENREALSDAMMTYYSQFARTGDPNPPESELPVWKPWTRRLGENERIIFDSGGPYLEKDKQIKQGRLETLARLIGL
ncbi:MAG: carboxylesterase family protein [Proteobacteria bacterium]|nr:carboxylesterase family protein [Pseudomonadota bacterium]